MTDGRSAVINPFSPPARSGVAAAPGRRADPPGTGAPRSDERRTFSIGWIYTYDRASGRLISSRRAGDEELRQLEAQGPATERYKTMEPEHVIVKYYNRIMLSTVDLHALLVVLFDTYGDDSVIEFVPMSDLEQEMAADNTGIVPGVRDRFLVLEPSPDGTVRRRSDLERIAIRTGLK